MNRLGVLAAFTLFILTSSPTGAQPSQVRSLLDDIDAWETVASDGVDIRVSSEPLGAGKPCMRIDFDFRAGAGYGGVLLKLPIELPENYEFTCNVRGEGPANNLELKLVDPDGLNVWWVNRRAYEWPAEPTRLVNQRRHFQFAWGPSGGAPLKKVGQIELIVAASEGGKGTVWIDDFRFNPLPPITPYTGTPVVSASSNQRDVQSLLSDKPIAWIADDGDANPWVSIDFGQPREIGGLVIERPAECAPTRFDVEVSGDGARWSGIRPVRGATALPSELALPDLQTRWIRLAFKETGTKSKVGVSRIQFLDTATGASLNAFWRARAARAAKGIFPRTLRNEQSFWTVVGQPDDDAEALINEEGQVEVDRRGFSLEPFIVRDDKLLTWADGTHTQSLREGWVPIPSVVRTHDGLELTVTALAAGESKSTALHVAYTVRNTSNVPAQGRLAVAVRPIQVLPPWQDLNITGGWTAIRSITCEKDGMLVNGGKNEKRVRASQNVRVGALPYDAGDPVEHLVGNHWPPTSSLHCPQQSATGMLYWEFDLAPGATATHLVCVPLHGIAAPVGRPRDLTEFESLAKKVAAEWAARVNKVTVQLPRSAKQLEDTIRATQAYILINHDGDGFQPGSRTYNRSWMRDGSMTSAAMLELGHDALVKRFIEWYAPFQFPSGKVPCVVDRRGADPVPEHDSSGQFIWLIANYYRYTGDKEFVRTQFPRVKSAVTYIESLRAERMTDEFGSTGIARQEPGKPPVPAQAFRGLVPESISHEGYSAKPMHSFWDTFFILRGLDDAAFLAGVVGDPELARRWTALTDDFRKSLIDSIRIAQQAHGIDYLPGCVELGDFDSTSSTILLWPVDQASHFPRAWIDATFERYWREFTKRRDQVPATWDAYTPYELRHVGAFVRLGQKDRAHAVLNWLLTHQRPAGWRHFAEVVWRERSNPRMIGDMPHTWCGSDFLNSVRAMFVYEDHANNRLVVLAGVPDDWLLDGETVGFADMRTEHGTLSATAGLVDGNRVNISVSGTAHPKGGFELVSPLQCPIRAVRVDGKPVELTNGNRIAFTSLPASIEVDYDPAQTKQPRP